MNKLGNAKKFVAQAMGSLGRIWEMVPNSEDNFFWMSMMHVDGRIITADFSALFNNVPDDVNPRQAKEIISDAINIVTYEHKIMEAVICYNSTISPYHNTYGSSTVVAFNYHGILGQKFNFRPICIIDDMKISDRPYLGKCDKPIGDVTKWMDAKPDLFRDLVPHQKVRLDITQHEDRWYLSVCDLAPKVLPNATVNGFKSRFEAIEHIKMIEEVMQTYNAEKSVLQKINREFYAERKRRCPIKMGINYGGIDKPW
jgi:hypothetical protein